MHPVSYEVAPALHILPSNQTIYSAVILQGTLFLTAPGVEGAPDDQTEATAANLKLAGYKDWKGLILRDNSERTTPTTEYKSGARARIVAQGYRLILNRGDQWSDLNGSPKAELNVKLPNPYYYLR